MGHVDDVTIIDKFGFNPDLDNGTEETIWAFGGDLEYSTSDDIDTVSSSSASDTGTLTISGITKAGVLTEQTVTMNGQTQVTLTTPLYRVNRMIYSHTADNVGNLYCYVNGSATAGVPDTSGDVRAYIGAGDGQTQLSVYTTPANATSFIRDLWFSLGSKTSGGFDVVLRVRPDGGAWLTKFKGGVSFNGGSPPPIPEIATLVGMYDIEVRATADTNNTALGTGFRVEIFND
jgi:hypothetical protein